MITSVFNHKGGSGKSTTAVNLAAALALKGYKVLFVDLDAQCNGSKYVGTKDFDVMSGLSIYDILFENADPKDVVRETGIVGLSCIPASMRMKNASTRLSQDPLSGPGTKLYSSFRRSKIAAEYDYIFLDCPSEIDVITANALNLADTCIVPVFADKFSMDGLIETNSAIQSASMNGTGSEISLMGVVLCNYRGFTKVAAEIANDLKEALPENLFNTKIKQSAAVPTSIAADMPVVKLDPRSAVSKEFIALADEYIVRCSAR